MDDMGMDVTMSEVSVGVDAVSAGVVDTESEATFDAVVNDISMGGAAAGVVADGAVDAMVYSQQNTNDSGYVILDTSVWKEEQNWLGLGLKESEVLKSGGAVNPYVESPEERLAGALAKRLLQEQAMEEQRLKVSKEPNLSDNAKSILDGILKVRLPEPTLIEKAPIEIAPVVSEMKMPAASMAPVELSGLDMSDSMLP